MDLRQIAMLLIFFIVYVVIGGVVFMHIEAPNELEERQRLRDSEIGFREKIRNLHLAEEKEENLTQIINSFLTEQNIPILSADTGAEKLRANWDFLNSFFFAITVVTTIGYGHMAPSTTPGRVFTLVFALIGIPVTGILLGAIGDRFSRCFLDEIHKVRRRRSKYVSTKLLVLKRGLLFFVPWFAVFVILPAFIFYCFEEWTFLESFYYCFITLSTIGFGDFVAGHFDSPWMWFYKIAVVLWIIFGLAYLSMILNFISQGLRSNRLSHVVHSIRLTGPHSIHGFKHGLRSKQDKDRIRSKNSNNNINNNGSVLFAADSPSSLTPTPSPTNLHSAWSDTECSNSPTPTKKSCSKFEKFWNCFKENEDLEEQDTPQSPQSPLTPMTSDILVIVTSSEGTSSHPLAQYSSQSTPNSNYESQSPQTRSELKDSRRKFFQDLEVMGPMPSAYV